MCQWNKNYRDIGTVFAKAMAQKENQACYQSTVRRQIYSCAQACKVIRDLNTFKKQKDRVKMTLWVKTVSLLFCFIENIFQLLILSLRFDFWSCREKKSLWIQIYPWEGAHAWAWVFTSFSLLFCSPWSPTKGCDWCVSLIRLLSTKIWFHEGAVNLLRP